jgi:hypothetical protein
MGVFHKTNNLVETISSLFLVVSKIEVLQLADGTRGRPKGCRVRSGGAGAGKKGQAGPESELGSLTTKVPEKDQIMALAVARQFR